MRGTVSFLFRESYTLSKDSLFVESSQTIISNDNIVTKNTVRTGFPVNTLFLADGVH
jgi:hypothetical protein